MSVKLMMKRGNFTANNPGDVASLPHLLGSGRFGGVFDCRGAVPSGQTGFPGITHLDFFDADSDCGYGQLLTVGHWKWSEIPKHSPKEYNQELIPYSGRLTTRIIYADWNYQLSWSFHPEYRDLLIGQLTWQNNKGTMPDLIWQHDDGKIGSETPVWWTQDNCSGGLRLEVEKGYKPLLEKSGKAWKFRFPQGQGETAVYLVFGSKKRLPELESELYKFESVSEALLSAESAWERAYGEAFVLFPGKAGEMFARSYHHLLASFSQEKSYIAPPCGLSGYGWRRFFPMDLSFIHSALLYMGHADIVRSWCEFYNSRIGQMLEYTKRLFNKDGCMWAWEFPLSSTSIPDKHQNNCYFEIHNAVYPAKTAFDAAVFSGDLDWLKSIAWPIIRESARFFTSCARQHNNGKYGIYCTPFSGQDEASGEGGNNYLCSLFAADWIWRAASLVADKLNVKDRETVHWRQLANAGADFTTLLKDNSSIYAADSRFTALERMGKQKHPVQLNRFWSLPAPLRTPDYNAWTHRHELCLDNSKMGWSQLTFLRGAATLGNVDIFMEELNKIIENGFCDRDFLQLEETPYELMLRYGWKRTPYYLTNEALFMSAIIELITKTNNFPADLKNGIKFGNISTPLNNIFSREEYKYLIL